MSNVWLEAVLEELRRVRGLDLSDYRRATLERRIAARLARVVGLMRPAEWRVSPPWRPVILVAKSFFLLTPHPSPLPQGERGIKGKNFWQAL
ncbi:MAG: hypothetical protein ACYC6G_01995 [Desulfobaccales bacterium]